MRVLIVDDHPEEWLSGRLGTLCNEIQGIDHSVCISVNDELVIKGRGEHIHFEVRSPGQFTEGIWDGIASRIDFAIFDVSLGDDLNEEGRALAGAFIARTGFCLHRAIFATNTSLRHRIQSGGVKSLGTDGAGELLAYSKDQPKHIAEAILATRCAPQRRTTMSRPLMKALYIRCGVDDFFHDGRYGSTRTSALQSLSGDSPIVKVDEVVELKELMENQEITDDQLFEVRKLGRNGLLADVLGRHYCDPSEANSAAERFLNEVAAREDRMYDVLFPEMTLHRGKCFSHFLHDVFRSGGCWLNESPSQLSWLAEEAGEELNDQRPLSVRIPLGWIKGLNLLLRDTVRYAKLDGKPFFYARHEFKDCDKVAFCLWHCGDGYRGQEKLLKSASGLFDQCISWSHVFIVSRTTSASSPVIACEVLPEGRSRILCTPVIRVGQSSIDLIQFSGGSCYLFLFPTSRRERPKMSREKQKPLA